MIPAPRRTQPRQFDVYLDLQGKRWRKVLIEVSFGDGNIGSRAELVVSPGMKFFGLDSPGQLVGIAMDYQVAQKLHACTEPHRPPEFSNTRVRDIVDLVLIREAFYNSPTALPSLREAAEDIFRSRLEEDRSFGKEGRQWPPVIQSNPLWEITYATPATQVGLVTSLQDAIASLNEWISQIANA